MNRVKKLVRAACPRVFALSLVALAPLGACKGGSPVPSSAEVRWSDAGAAELAIGGKAASLPPEDLDPSAHPQVQQDAEGTRFAYATKSGELRLVYRIGEGYYPGPHIKPPLDFRTVPALDAALGAIFESTSSAARASLVDDVVRALGDGGLAKMLVAGAYVDAPEWDAAWKKLPPGNADEVKKGLATFLEAGKPARGLRRAVALVPLREPARTDALDARVRELLAPMSEPRSLAVMVRALAATAVPRAAKLGCDVLARTPLDVTKAMGTPEEIDLPGREALVEAALLAIANDTLAGSPLACDRVEATLEDPCVPQVRCAKGAPLTGLEATNQDEALCTKAELRPVVAHELERAPGDVLALQSGTRRDLFAYAALAAADKVPPTVAAQHEHRRYAVVQPKDPACDRTLVPGTPCHCDEPAIRDQACRHRDPGIVSFGVCRFGIDEKKKQLSEVVATLPP